MKGSTLRNSLITLIAVLFFLTVWKIAAMLIGAEIILPHPETTFKYLFDVVRSDEFLQSLTSTLARGITGFVFASCLGILVGFIAGFSKTVFFLCQPFIVLIRSTPTMSIILLALIWFGSELVPVFVVFLIAFPIMAINVIEGVKNIDVKLLEMAKVYNIRFVKRVKDIYFPSILPYMIAGISNALGIGWRVAISAEVLSHPAFGVGTELYEAKIFLETGMVFAWTLVAIIVGFMLEKLLRILERKLQPWKEL